MTNFDYNGILTCASYAFPPNSLHYCGPEKQNNLLAYQREQIADAGLAEIVRDFQTLYPYLTLIAHENNIADPFDPRVVEAYWIGNGLLKNVKINNFYHHLHDSLGLKKRVKPKDLELLYGKLPIGLLPHHTFHVLNIFTRTGHHTTKHTLETMDACRISWGQVKNCELRITTPTTLYVETRPLILQNGKLALGKHVTKQIHVQSFQSQNTTYHIPNTKFVSFHWDTFCDILTDQQAKRLEYYTEHALQLANTTL